MKLLRIPDYRRGIGSDTFDRFRIKPRQISHFLNGKRARGPYGAGAALFQGGIIQERIGIGV